MESWMRWVLRSYWVTRASTFSPLEKRSGRWSLRSRQIGAADERGHLGVGDADFDAAVVHFGHRAGHHRALADAFVAGGIGHFANCELLDTERDTLLVDIDVEHLGLDHVTTVVGLESLLTGLLPVEVGEVDHAVDIAIETDEDTELGLVLDLALDDGTRGVLMGEGFPRRHFFSRSLSAAPRMSPSEAPESDEP